MIAPLDPRKWPGLIAFPGVLEIVVELTYAEVDSWEWQPYTPAEIAEMGKRKEKNASVPETNKT